MPEPDDIKLYRWITYTSDEERIIIRRYIANPRVTVWFGMTSIAEWVGEGIGANASELMDIIDEVFTLPLKWKRETVLYSGAVRDVHTYV